MKTKFYRAGVIPYYFDSHGMLKMLFMKPSNPNFGGPDFQIAKGKIDDGESAEVAAFREGFEELGLLDRNIRSRHFLGTYMNRTSIFVCEIRDPDDFCEPTYETGETKWLTYNQYMSGHGRDLHAHIVGDAMTSILENHALQI